MRFDEEARKNFGIFCDGYRKKYEPMLMALVRKCNVCGKKFLRAEYNLRRSSNDILDYVKENGVCFECGYWLYLMNHKPRGFQVTNGIAYRILPFIEQPTISMLLGSKGKKCYFVTKRRKLIKSNDVWVIGKIPERFRKKFPDTGWFCDKRVYGRLLKFDKLCKEAGCLDRYKCFRFDTKLELKNGPYNKVPEKWTIGGERCGFFINTDLIENYISPLNNK